MLNQIGLAFLGLALSTGIAVLCSFFFARFGETARRGILGGVLASGLTWLATLAYFGASAGGLNFAAVIVAPACEELTRVMLYWRGRFAVGDGSSRWFIVALAIGFVSIEVISKNVNLMAYAYRAGATEPFRLIAIFIAPIVPLTLHVFLMFTLHVLRARRVSRAAAFAILVLLHFAHNASALLIQQPSDISTLTLLNAIRIFLLSSLAYFAWILLRRTERR